MQGCIFATHMADQVKTGYTQKPVRGSLNEQMLSEEIRALRIALEFCVLGLLVRCDIGGYEILGENTNPNLAVFYP